jgi:hypothetical protein
MKLRIWINAPEGFHNVFEEFFGYAEDGYFYSDGYIFELPKVTLPNLEKTSDKACLRAIPKHDWFSEAYTLHMRKWGMGEDEIKERLNNLIGSCWRYQLLDIHDLGIEDW